MSKLRFGHLFALLMLGSFISAFVLPARVTIPARGAMDGLFSPIARPVRAMSLLLLHRERPERPVDIVSPTEPRTNEAVLKQNRQLLLQLANLSAKFDRLAKLNADRLLVGANLRDLCRPASVIGTDPSGFRQALLIGPSFSHFQVDQPVIYVGGIVGRIERAGISGDVVRLITDQGFSCTAMIGQYLHEADGKVTLHWVPNLTPLVQGIGENAMAVRNTITMQQVKDLNIGVHDMVALNDDDWPENLRGYWLGQITAIRPQTNAPLFADIRIAPTQNLLRLKEVMVMVRR